MPDSRLTKSLGELVIYGTSGNMGIIWASLNSLKEVI